MPETRFVLEKLIEVIPYIHIGFTSCLNTLTIIVGKLSSLKSTTMIASTCYEQFAYDKKEYSRLYEEVLTMQDAVIALQAI